MDLKQNINLLKGDCLELMKELQDNSIDLILCDLPYGITNNSWDKVLDLNKLFVEYNRIIKDTGNIVLFSQEPFTSELIFANKKYFRYDLIWHKNIAVGFLHAKYRPLKEHENILIFNKKPTNATYNPQFTIGKPYKTTRITKSKNYRMNKIRTTDSDGKRYPKTILKFSKLTKLKHPTQKPLELLKYLIKTYSNENDTVLDNCMGSGSTGIACKEAGRRFIGMEITDEYYNIALTDIKNHLVQMEIEGA